MSKKDFGFYDKVVLVLTLCQSVQAKKWVGVGRVKDH